MIENPLIHDAGQVDEKAEILEHHSQKLQDYFVENCQERGGVAITKDNFDYQFEAWVEDLDLAELRKIVD